MTRALLALLLVSCGHVTKRTHETTDTKESAASTASSAAVTEQLNVAEQRKSVRRTARRTTTTPEGWSVSEEVIDDLLTVASTGALRVDSASASATAEKAKTTHVEKQTEAKRSPWWWAWWFPALLVIGLLGLAWRFRRSLP